MQQLASSALKYCLTSLCQWGRVPFYWKMKSLESSVNYRNNQSCNERVWGKLNYHLDNTTSDDAIVESEFNEGESDLIDLFSVEITVNEDEDEAEAEIEQIDDKEEEVNEDDE
ncbi:hypothetical protein FQA39_LY06488 [Lamprigera yunnana]|nr:hypothetical protein FQA39_LY06488 [Lamprigera yunnana]